MRPARFAASVLALAVGAVAQRDTAVDAPAPECPEAALTVADRAAATEGFARHTFREVHFGDIPVVLTLYAADAATARAAATAAFARVRELAAWMDDYALDPPSALNAIAAAAPEPVVVPAPLFAVLEHAVAMHARTGGAFDITAKPCVQLWRVSQKLGVLPPAERLARARALVDITALELDAVASTARLTRPGMWLDLGGIAKGLIGDEVVAVLRAAGVPRCTYHAGGDMVFGAAPPGLPGWPVHVADLPVDDGTTRDGTLAFWAADSAASVSGDVFRFVEIDGVRYAHVIDPRTGLGVTERRIACVRGPRGVDTDPLATAGLVMDEAAWRAAVARVPDCAGFVAGAAVTSAVRQRK